MIPRRISLSLIRGRGRGTKKSEDAQRVQERLAEIKQEKGGRSYLETERGMWDHGREQGEEREMIKAQSRFCQRLWGKLKRRQR